MKWQAAVVRGAYFRLRCQNPVVVAGCASEQLMPNALGRRPIVDSSGRQRYWAGGLTTISSIGGKHHDHELAQYDADRTRRGCSVK